MRRIAIIDHASHELMIEDINEQELEELYGGDEQKYIDDNYAEQYSNQRNMLSESEAIDYCDTAPTCSKAVLPITLEEKLEPVKKDAKNNKRKAVKGEPDKQSSAVYCRKG